DGFRVLDFDVVLILTPEGVGRLQPLFGRHALPQPRRAFGHTDILVNFERRSSNFPVPDRLVTPRFLIMCAYSFTVFVSVFQLLPTAPYHIIDLGGTTAAAALFPRS